MFQRLALTTAADAAVSAITGIDFGPITKSPYFSIQKKGVGVVATNVTVKGTLADGSPFSISGVDMSFFVSVAGITYATLQQMGYETSGKPEPIDFDRKDFQITNFRLSGTDPTGTIQDWSKAQITPPEARKSILVSRGDMRNKIKAFIANDRVELAKTITQHLPQKFKLFVGW